MVDRLQASNWSERDEAIAELERYVVTNLPQSLSPQLHKVKIVVPVVQIFY